MVFRGIAGLEVVKLRHRDGAIREIGGKLSGREGGVSDELVGTVVVMAGFEIRILHTVASWLKKMLKTMTESPRRIRFRAFTRRGTKAHDPHSRWDRSFQTQ